MDLRDRGFVAFSFYAFAHLQKFANLGIKTCASPAVPAALSVLRIEPLGRLDPSGSHR